MIQLCILISALAGPAQYERIDGANGAPLVLLAPRKTGDAVMIVEFNAGRYDDNEKPGLTRLAMHTLLESGAHGYRRFLHDVYAAGGSVSARTEICTSSVELRAPALAFPALARALLDRLFRGQPILANVTAARARLTNDAGADTGDALMDLVGIAGIDDPRFRAIAPTEDDDLDNIAPDELVVHIARFLTPANSVIVVTGDFPTTEIKKLVRSYSGGKRFRRTRSQIVVPNTYEIAHILELHVLIYPLSLASPKNIAAARVAVAILDERLTRRLRAEGVAYAPEAHLESRGWQEFAMLVLPIRPVQVEKATEAIEEELAELQKELSVADFERNRNYVQVTTEHANDDAADLALLLQRSARLGVGSYGRDAERALSALTASDVSAWLRQFISKENCLSISVTRRALDRVIANRRSRGRR